MSDLCATYVALGPKDHAEVVDLHTPPPPPGISTAGLQVLCASWLDGRRIASGGADCKLRIVEVDVAGEAR